MSFQKKPFTCVNDDRPPLLLRCSSQQAAVHRLARSRARIAVVTIHNFCYALTACVCVCGCVLFLRLSSVQRQMGDIFDRGDDDLPIEEWVYKLAQQADRANGALYSVMGNHEVGIPRMQGGGDSDGRGIANLDTYRIDTSLALDVYLGSFLSVWCGPHKPGFVFSRAGRETRPTHALLGSQLPARTPYLSHARHHPRPRTFVQMMNAMGDHSMATRKAFIPFLALRPELDELVGGDWSALDGFPEWARCRLVAMRPGGPVARLMAAHAVSMKVGGPGWGRRHGWDLLFVFFSRRFCLCVFLVRPCRVVQSW